MHWNVKWAIYNPNFNWIELIISKRFENWRKIWNFISNLSSYRYRTWEKVDECGIPKRLNVIRFGMMIYANGNFQKNRWDDFDYHLQVNIPPNKNAPIFNIQKYFIFFSLKYGNMIKLPDKIVILKLLHCSYWILYHEFIKITLNVNSTEFTLGIILCTVWQISRSNYSYLILWHMFEYT